MEFVILMFLITWKHQLDVEKLRNKQDLEERKFQHWLETHPPQPGDGTGAGIAATAALAAAAACCI